jgi:hypothetical protein
MKVAVFALSILALAASLGEARAQQILAQPPAPAASAAARRDERGEAPRGADRALAEHRQRRIDECEQNHGSEIDCAREVDTEIGAERLQSGARVIRLKPAR